MHDCRRDSCQESNRALQFILEAGGTKSLFVSYTFEVAPYSLQVSAVPRCPAATARSSFNFSEIDNITEEDPLNLCGTTVYGNFYKVGGNAVSSNLVVASSDNPNTAIYGTHRSKLSFSPECLLQ